MHLKYFQKSHVQIESKKQNYTKIGLSKKSQALQMANDSSQ